MHNIVRRDCASGIPLLLLAVLLLSPSCSGSTSEVTALPEAAKVTPLAAPDTPAVLGMPQLPAPSAINRGLSMVETGLAVHGGSFRADLTNQNVVRSGNNALFDPDFTSGDNPLYSKVALAIYSFDLSAFSSDDLALVDLDVDGIQDLMIGTSHVFAGWPAVTHDKWMWTELTRSSSTAGAQSFSWGVSNPGQLSKRCVDGVLSVCVVIYGDTAVDVSRVALVSPPGSTGGTASSQLLFRKGWDGTVKGSAYFGSSVSVLEDDLGRVHATCFDSSNQQLYYFQLDNRVFREMCVDCDSSSGRSNELCPTPDGGLLVCYTDDDRAQGLVRWMAPESISSLIWSPRSNFDSGEDPTGASSAVGGACRCVYDDAGVPHVFYEDETSSRIKHAWKPQGSAVWLNEFVSPPGQVASCPVPVRCADGTCCAYLVRSSGGGGSGGAVYLYLAQEGADGWFADVLADDVHCPLDNGPAGFCDGSVKPGTDTVVLAYSSLHGVSVIHRDVAARNTLSSSSLDRGSSSGAYLRMCMLGDGSVRLLHYDTSSKTVFFEDGDIPAGQDFISTPVLVYDGKDDDCDGLDFWVDPDSDDDGLHEVVVVDLSSSVSTLTGGSKKEFKGHVTLLK